MKTSDLCFVILLFSYSFALTGLSAQETVNASGADATSDGGSISYSVGQITSANYTISSASVAEGVQQPFEISILTAIENTDNTQLTITAFPNPSTDYLTLKITNLELSNLAFQLYDVSGKLLQSNKIIDTRTSIAIEHLKVSTYFVKVVQDNKEIKTFTIIKK